jgi:GNAT superfamily N-acetyltransferase
MPEPASVTIRDAAPDDLPGLQAVRSAAFAPVFAGFRAAVGAEVAAVALAGAEEAQAALLDALAAPGSDWRLLVAEADGGVRGFTCLTTDRDRGLGEVGLTAVAPAWQRRGVGRALVAAALDALASEGMRAATVGTGGDAAHAPARRLYASLGFDAVIPSVHLYRPL